MITNYFRDIQSKHPDLAGFPDVPALLEHQHARYGDPNTKNETLRALVTAAQSHAAFADTARILVLLALWPGLDALHGRLSRYYRQHPDILCAELSARMAEAIARVDLARVDRLAATLLMNVRRDIMRPLKRDWARKEAPLDESIAAAEAPPNTSPDLALQRLKPLIGQDAGLVVAVVLMGFTQKEAARALGMGHDAARKRYQRALAKLRALDGKLS
ncbi:sigma-70 family RNA polymerase sigma factor [Roseovarius sp. THAF8]|uniref:sigma-70 family RNA polymerase sigma factor n=1 Tax=Roseovarius sp. THAF8 TaxID=2587846 RepID=UPI00126962CE|nr:sigma-70 family RNA polymerase sigma factor [Roseovarius sp. THAF8]